MGWQNSFLLACSNGHKEIMEMLINKSAEFKIDTEAKDDNGYNAFHLAYSEGHQEIAGVLIKASDVLKIDLNGKTYYGYSAFQ